MEVTSINGIGMQKCAMIRSHNVREYYIVHIVYKEIEIRLCDTHNSKRAEKLVNDEVTMTQQVINELAERSQQYNTKNVCTSNHLTVSNETQKSIQQHYISHHRRIHIYSKLFRSIHLCK